MNPLHIIKYPIDDITRCNLILKEMALDKKAFKAGEINSAVLEKRKSINLIKFCTISSPIILTTLTISLFGAYECYEAYQSGIPFNEFFGSGFKILREITDHNFKTEKNYNFIESLSAGNPEELKNYISYISNGSFGFIKDLGEKFINHLFILSAAAVYGVSNMAMKSLGFLTGETSIMHKYKMSTQENFKLNILRDNFQDPVFDNLNNEELFSMTLTFNEILNNNYQNKKKLLKPAILAIDKITVLLKPLRKAFNKSTNDKKRLMSNVFEYLDSDIDKDNIANTLKKYGITTTEFNSIADRGGVLTENEKYQYLSGLNKRALVSAYRRKTKDDAMLAFSLTLEDYIIDKKEVEKSDKMTGFENFLKMYTRENRILKREKLPEDLRVMLKIVNGIKSKKGGKIREIIRFKENGNYIDFLRKHSPHLIEDTGEKKVFLNNYSFISYYEAEKERLAKLDVVNQRIYENTHALYRNSKSNNAVDYRKKENRLVELTKEAVKLHDIFFDNNALIAKEFDSEVSDIFKPEITRVSSIYNDSKNGYEITVKNFSTIKEEELLMSGEALKERGIDIKELERLRKKLDLNTTNKDVGRKIFKNKGRRFK